MSFSLVIRRAPAHTVTRRYLWVAVFYCGVIVTRSVSL